MYKADAASATVDTITTALVIPGGTNATNGFANIAGSVYNTTLYFTLADSAVLAFKTTAYNQVGDKLTLVILNTTNGHWLQLLGYSGLASAWQTLSGNTKVVLNSAKNAVLTFVFDGTY